MYTYVRENIHVTSDLQFIITFSHKECLISFFRNNMSNTMILIIVKLLNTLLSRKKYWLEILHRNC